MPNPTGPDRDNTSMPPGPDRGPQTGQVSPPVEQPTDPNQQVTGAEFATQEIDTSAAAPTEMFATTDPQQVEPERRFTAPGFDAGATQIIPTGPSQQTEVIPTAPHPGKAAPQLIPPRPEEKPPAASSRRWGWVLALILVVLALAAIAVLGTVWLTRENRPKQSQEDQVKTTILNYDAALQKGDLAALRGMTCGSQRDGYLAYNDQAWTDTHNRVEAARRYPVIAEIGQVIINGDHAEANVTAFMAYAPQVRSTRSLDLQFRDDQWKICQAPTG